MFYHLDVINLVPSGELTCDRDKFCRCKIGSKVPKIFRVFGRGCERQSDVRELKDRNVLSRDET